MTTKQLVTASNLGGGHFRKNARTKQYEIDISQFVDNQSTFVRENKIKATSTTFVAPDFQYLNGVDLNKLRVIGSYGDYGRQINVRIQKHIGTISMDMGRFNINYVKTKFQNDTNGNLYDVISSLQINGDFDMWLEANNLPTRTRNSGYISSEDSSDVDWNFDKLEQTVFISYGDNTNKKYYKLYRKSTGLARGSYYPNVDPRYAIDPSVRGTAYQAVNAKNLNLNWTNWHVENLDSAPITTQPPVEYTASNGVKKVGNDFQVDLLNKSTNDLKLVNGKLFTPKGLDLMVTQCYPIITTTSTIKKSNGYRGTIAVAVIPTYQPYNYFGVDNQGADQARVQPKLDDVKVSLTFKDGSEQYVTGVRLAKNGLAKDDDVVIEDKFNMDLNNTNINNKVSNLTYTGNTISFDVSQIRAFNQLPVMLIFDLDLSSANIDQQTNISAGSSISTTNTNQLLNIHAQIAGELVFAFTKRV